MTYSILLPEIFENFSIRVFLSAPSESMFRFPDFPLSNCYERAILQLLNDRHLGPSYMVSGTRDNPHPEESLLSVYM